MLRASKSLVARVTVWGIYFTALLVAGGVVLADKIEMKDGRLYEGRLARLSTAGQQPLAVPADGAPEAQPIVLIDDNLRRTFVPKYQVLRATAADLPANEAFDIPQTVVRVGAAARATPIGPIVRIEPWDEFGRRILVMTTAAGQVNIIQGITKITPLWTKVESIQQRGKNYYWDMRIATSSIPIDALKKIVHKRLDPKNLDGRLKIVRLLTQAERYYEAQAELDTILKDFPENKRQFDAPSRELLQLSARRALEEIKVRRTAGQHKFAIKMLEGFPAEGVAGETLQAVKQMLDEYRLDYDRVNQVIQEFDEHRASLDNSELKTQLGPIRDEIAEELNLHSLDRMGPYRQSWEDHQKPEPKLALAISGWLVGADNALQNLPVAMSLVKVRDLVRQFLAEPSQAKRSELLSQISTQEGATPELVAKLLQYLLPPLDIEAQKDAQPKDAPPGFYELKVDSNGDESPTTYYVQLPREYDPHRRYPTVITLNGAGTTPQLQIDWWAGSAGPDGTRQGQGARFGYIVIAPVWAKEGQEVYHFSAAEHAAVLNSLRDATRRFSIDTDRVFLSGHSMGGDAAWDIGIAHPDLWAGVIPIVGRRDKYIPLLWENFRRVPFYLVGGNLDGGTSVQNALEVDRYMKHNFNATWVEYQGRCHENFSDDVLRLFDWMSRYQRDFFPEDFVCHSMRPWDNFFWWVELDDFSEKAMVDPEEFPRKGAKAARTKALVNAKNGLNVTTGADKTTVWLAPELVNFQLKISVTVNGKTARLPAAGLRPSLSVLLEDARTRADRLHPFWAKVEMPSGEVNGGE